MLCSTLQHMARHCTILHCTAVHYHTLHHTATQTATNYSIVAGYGWLQVVVSLKLQVSFAGYILFYRALLQKRTIILRSLLIVATPYETMPHSHVLQSTAAHDNTLHHTALHCGALPYTAQHCNTDCNKLQHRCRRRDVALQACSAIYGNTLERTATHCSTTALHCNVVASDETRPYRHVLQHSATHCSAWQHTATHCDTLHHIVTHCTTLQHTLQQTATSLLATRHCFTCTLCKTLQHAATCCNTL